MHNVSRTGNIILDSLVNNKYAIASREGICFEVCSVTPSELPFQGSHLSIILGNLLDNALDACRMMESGERWIEMAVAYEKEMLFIKIENSLQGERYKDSSRRYLTTKKDKKNHGIGLLSVQRSVDQYGGELLTECTDGVFRTKVVLYGEA